MRFAGPAPILDCMEPALSLAGRATFAQATGNDAVAADLALAAAEAFLAEHGETGFDAPNLLRIRAEALLSLGRHAAAVEALERAAQLMRGLPAGEPFDRLRLHLDRLETAPALMAAVATRDSSPARSGGVAGPVTAPAAPPPAR